MPTKTLVPNAYIPTASRGGNATPTIFRGRNGFVRGRGENTVFECYGGSLNLNEQIPSAAITGTISFSAASTTVSGTSTKFLDELHIGQSLITAAGVLLNVAEVLTDTSFIAFSLPQSAGANVAAYRQSVLFEMNRRRGTLLSGNAYEADTGNILAAGSGTLRINGEVLSESLIASRRLKIAVADTAGYQVYELGFNSVPVGITAGAAGAAVVKTFTSASVNTGTSYITVTAHGYFTGQAVNFTTGDALPAPLLPNTAYYLIKIDDNTLQVAGKLQDAAVGDFIPLTTAGAGTITINPISKEMPAGARGIRVAKASTKLNVPLYGNPSENIKVTLTAGGRIALTFPAMDSRADASNLHDAWRIYGTLAGSETDVWYYIRTVSAAELGGNSGGTYYLEYLDGEVRAQFQLISFDNDAPPDAEFVASVTGYPVLVSCQGKPTAERPLGTSPGVSVVPLKVSNFAAAPLVLDSGQRAEVPTSPPETIIGFYLAAGRLYLLTANSLPIAVFTADSSFPIATRPFWKSGFRNPYAVCFVQGRLYGFTTYGAVRSVADGEEGSEEHSFAADVEEITKTWDASRVMVCHDPANECVCFIYGGAYQKNGFWGSIILPFMLRFEAWSPPIYVENAAKDMVITGAATVGGNLEFLAGGRQGYVDTYRFDGGLNAGEEVEWSLVWSLSDEGSESRPKTIKYPRVTGRTADASVGVFGALAGETVSVADIEAGTVASKSGAIALPSSTSVTVYERMQVKVSDLSVYAIGAEGVWSGGERARIDEISYEVLVDGSRK